MDFFSKFVQRVKMVESDAVLKPGQKKIIGEYIAKPKNNPWVELKYLDAFRKEAKKRNLKYRVIYRGPRNKTIWGSYQGSTNKSDAFYFVAYQR